MKNRFLCALIVCSIAGHGLAARADVWDTQTISDNLFSTTRNELVHGSDQLHDMAALAGPTADADWYRVSQRPYSSYEVVVEGVSGDVFGKTFQVQRIASDGTTVLQSSAAVGIGYVRSLRWANQTASAVGDELIVVRGAACGTSCGADDTYRIRFFETTYAAPRFNNAGTQVSVLLLQNPTDYTATGTTYLWNSNGTMAGSEPFTLAPKQLHVLQLQTVASGVSGSMTIAHNGRYGDLTGKVVSLEPATGFSFDTIVTPRPK